MYYELPSINEGTDDCNAVQTQELKWKIERMKMYWNTNAMAFIKKYPYALRNGSPIPQFKLRKKKAKSSAHTTLLFG